MPNGMNEVPPAERVLEIDIALRELGVPDSVTPRGLAKRTQIPSETLRNAVRKGIVPKLHLSGPRGEVFASRESWAAYFASGNGCGVWKRSVRRRASGKRWTQQQYTEWYKAIPIEGEVWRQFPASLGDGSLHGVYALSNYGRIRRLLAAQGTSEDLMPVPTLNENGYAWYTFKRPPTDKERLDAAARGEKAQSYELPMRVYEAVAAAFIAKPSGTVEVLHSGPRHDSSVKYLRWGTRKENMSEVKPMMGEDNPTARHTSERIRMVLQLKRAGMKQRDIARELEMDEATVSDVLNGHKWQSVTGLQPKPTRARPGDSARQQMMADLGRGMPPAKVAEKHAVSTAFVWKLRAEMIEAGELDRAVVGSVRKRKEPITEAMAKNWAQMLAEGKTFEAISRETGRPASSIHYAIKKFGLMPRKARA